MSAGGRGGRRRGRSARPSGVALNGVWRSGGRVVHPAEGLEVGRGSARGLCPWTKNVRGRGDGRGGRRCDGGETWGGRRRRGCGQWVQQVWRECRVATWLTVGLVDPASDLLLLAQVGVDGLGGEIVFGHGEVSGRGDRGCLFKGKRMTIRPNKMHRDIVTSMPWRCHIGNLSKYHILRCKYYYPAYSSIVIASLFHLPDRRCRHDEPRLGVAVR